MAKKKATLTIQFDSEAMARGFALWLCESGEQSYWQWQENNDDDGNETAKSFDYHSLNGFEFGINIIGTAKESP